MRIPDFSSLQNCTEFNQEIYAQKMHTNPQFYKYRWWIFWRESACDGVDFFNPKHSLCTADAMALITELSERNLSHWIYNQKIPRRDHDATPFHFTSSRWLGKEFAPALFQDTDPLWNGHR